MKPARWWVRAAEGLLASFEELWSACCAEVAAGQTTEVHALRTDILEIVQTRMALLEEGLGVVQAIEKQSGEELPEEAALLRALARLDRMKQEMLGRWQTAEDLEDIVAEQMAPSEEEFQAVADRYGPPTVWFDECGKSRPELESAPDLGRKGELCRPGAHLRAGSSASATDRSYRTHRSHSAE